MTDKQAQECELVRRLFDLLHIKDFTLQPSDRPDVLATINNSRIGIEGTVFHNDEKSDSKGGSQLRKTEEEAYRRTGRPCAMWVNSDPMPALCVRIKVKVGKTYQMQGLDELWLLIDAQSPQLSALASTYMFPCTLNVNVLNERTHGMLRGSLFKRAYLKLSLDQSLYKWSASEGWYELQSPATASAGPELWFKAILCDPEWLRDPGTKARAEARKALDELSALKKYKIGSERISNMEFNR